MEYVTIILCVILLLIIIYNIKSTEGYVNRKEKASAIFSWFKDTENPTYDNYKKYIKNSDIIEYTDTKSLLGKNELTVSAIENII